MAEIRRLGPGDEAILGVLAREDPDFDFGGLPGFPRRPPGPGAAAGYLADPGVLHWVAEDGGEVVGHLLCYVLPRRSGDARELMLHEIGVRRSRRRRGVGRALIAAMDAWMADHGIEEVWVLADDAAVDFYAACGFTPDPSQPTQMSRR